MVAVSAPTPFGGTHRAVPKIRKCRLANEDGVVMTIDDKTSLLNVLLPTNDRDRTWRSPESPHSWACAWTGTNIARDARAAATQRRIAGTAWECRWAEIPFTAPREVRPWPAGDAIIMNTTRRFGGADTRRARADCLRRAHLIDA